MGSMGSMVTTSDAVAPALSADGANGADGVGGAYRPVVDIGALWATLVDPDRLDVVLSWPPDVFALVDRVLDASEAYRFVVSPPPGAELQWRREPVSANDWLEWLDRNDRNDRAAPDAISNAWQIVSNARSVRIDELGTGGEWDVIEALLFLHAVADEASAGLGSAAVVAPGRGCAFRAAARELFAESGSLSTISPTVLRVVPRCRSSTGGISIHSLSRHICVEGPQVDVAWHRMLSRPIGVTAPEAHANVLVLPWPLRVRARDFRPVPYALANMDPTRSRFFTFSPAEVLDLRLVDTVVRAALDEAGTVDVVVLPESAITPADIEPLEALLGQYGIWTLIAGVREPPADGHLGTNWVHVGVRQEVVWRHAIQHKHHRWRLDGRQIKQYHLGAALDPAMHWWEAVTIPPRSLQIIDQGGVTFATLVCEDLARLEPVAELVRAIGPSIVVALLLDGPQLASRWTARYASVLADDPGSAVCTVTSYGMVRRCRPPGCPPSRVVALWKDPFGDVTEIELEEGAQGVLIGTTIETGGSSTADGRRHRASTSTLTLAAVQSIWARDAPQLDLERVSSMSAEAGAHGRRLPPLDEREVSKATSWAEAVAEAVVADPHSMGRLMSDATAADWRASLGLPLPSRLFRAAIDAFAGQLPSPPTLDDVVAAIAYLRRSDQAMEMVTGMLLDIALEQRLLAEVRTGRLAPGVLRALGPQR